jgi:hypothetical protein
MCNRYVDIGVDGKMNESDCPYREFRPDGTIFCRSFGLTSENTESLCRGCVIVYGE